MDSETKGLVGIVFTSVLVVLAIIVAFKMFEVVNETERVVVVRVGEVKEVLQPGFHTVNPFLDDLYRMDVVFVKSEVEATAASNDLQDVTTKVSVQYQIDETKVESIYKSYGTQRALVSTVINPAIQDAIKAGTAQYNAEALITNRVEVKEAIESALRDRLEEAYVIVDNVDIRDFKFSDSFNAAIERKVTAEQQAFEQENITKQKEEIKKQTILEGEALAEKTRLEVEALSAGGDDIIRKIQAEAELERARKWNGVLPVNVYGSAPLPFLDVN
jgi:regulator of protease activity HflC (stomatin/prohibitin superfamily)